MNRVKNLEKMKNKAPQDVRVDLETIGGIKYASIWN